MMGLTSTPSVRESESKSEDDPHSSSSEKMSIKMSWLSEMSPISTFIPIGSSHESGTGYENLEIYHSTRKQKSATDKLTKMSNSQAQEKIDSKQYFQIANVQSVLAKLSLCMMEMNLSEVELSNSYLQIFPRSERRWESLRGETV